MEFYLSAIFIRKKLVEMNKWIILPSEINQKLVFEQIQKSEFPIWMKPSSQIKLNSPWKPCEPNWKEEGK